MVYVVKSNFDLVKKREKQIQVVMRAWEESGTISKRPKSQSLKLMLPPSTKVKFLILLHQIFIF